MMDHIPADGPRSSTPPPLILPRSGKRPLAVTGDVLVAGSQATDDNKITYDIAVIENGDAGFAARLTCSYDPAVEMTRHYAETFAEVDDAVQFFGTYSPADDVPVASNLDAAALAALTDDIANATTSYRALLTKLFPAMADQFNDGENVACPA